MGKSVIGISLDTEVWDEVKKLAKDNGRSFSNYLNTLLIEHIGKEKGNPSWRVSPPKPVIPKLTPRKSQLRRRNP